MTSRESSQRSGGVNRLAAFGRDKRSRGLSTETSGRGSCSRRGRERKRKKERERESGKARDFYSSGVEWRRRPAEATILTSVASLAVYNVLEDRLDHRFDLAISIRDAGRCTVLDAASKATGTYARRACICTGEPPLAQSRARSISMHGIMHIGHACIPLTTISHG